MTDQPDTAHLSIPLFSAARYALFVAVGVAIWTTGVVVVRLLGDDFFDQNSALLILMFAASIPLGVGTQYAVTALLRIPFEHTLVPVVTMCATALLLDGISVAFTDIYASSNEVKMTVGGWLLWTFGAQIASSLALILTRRHRS